MSAHKRRQNPKKTRAAACGNAARMVRTARSILEPPIIIIMIVAFSRTPEQHSSGRRDSNRNSPTNLQHLTARAGTRDARRSDTFSSTITNRWHFLQGRGKQENHAPQQQHKTEDASLKRSGRTTCASPWCPLVRKSAGRVYPALGFPQWAVAEQPP